MTCICDLSFGAFTFNIEFNKFEYKAGHTSNKGAISNMLILVSKSMCCKQRNIVGELKYKSGNV